MKRFYTIMSAQFLVAGRQRFVHCRRGTAQVMKALTGRPQPWSRCSRCTTVLAPFVGAADALPRRRVREQCNLWWAALMLFGLHRCWRTPWWAWGRRYSPAKYGILTELLPASQLVKANGWIEG
jgi:hypothetical protein